MKKASVPSIVLAVILLAVGVRAEAQQAKKIHRIGYLYLGLGIQPGKEAFRQSLHKLKWSLWMFSEVIHSDGRYHIMELLRFPLFRRMKLPELVEKSVIQADFTERP